MTDAFRILGIAGSLRRRSYNRGLLRAAAKVLPEGVEFEVYPLNDIPPFNADVLEAGEPAPVKDLKQQVAAADALLIATPENNYSIPGVLKNALDWVSRPPKASPLRHKPIGIIGASSGESGTAHAQLALRQVFVITNSLVLVQPAFRVPYAAQKFDENGDLTDDELLARLKTFIEALVDWGRLVGRHPS